MEYLFVCSLGPVQEFIATARRSRDLWYGSWMLSELSKAAAKMLGMDNLIFPAPKTSADLEPGSNLGVANKIVAIVDTNPADIGRQIKEAVQTRLEALQIDAFNKIKENGGEFDRTLAEEQIDDLLEFYWSAVPLPSRDKYHQARNTAESLLAARKNTRNFLQPKGSPKPKSSLDGTRESVIDERKYSDRHDSNAERERKAKDLYRHYRARPGERLSGVDLLKRLGEPKGKSAPRFYSTSHFAALPFMAQTQADELMNKISETYQEAGWPVLDNQKDGSLLYESRLSDSIPPGKTLEDLRTELNNLFQNTVGDQRPSTYYALLRADGDNMGLVIDGQEKPENHRDLSSALSDFALIVPEIIEDKKHQGKVIYAGGDDILAYLPLHTALECAAKLESTFRQRMDKFRGRDQNGQDVRPTLSAGIVIAHHLTPLSDIMAMSRDAEKKAKSISGKNALAIVLSKRSGVDRVIVNKWTVLNARLQEMTQFHRQKAISKGTAFELQILTRSLAETTIPAEAIRQEALFIIQRKREGGGNEKVNEAVIQQFQTWLEIDEVNIDNLAQEMLIANIFAGALDIAEGKLPIKQEEYS